MTTWFISLTSLVYFICFVFGVTLIINIGDIFEGLRQKIKSKSIFWYDFIVCPMCMGSWIGFAISFYMFGLVHYGIFNFLLGCAAGAIVWTLSYVAQTFRWAKYLIEYKVKEHPEWKKYMAEVE